MLEGIGGEPFDDARIEVWEVAFEGIWRGPESSALDCVAEDGPTDDVV